MHIEIDPSEKTSDVFLAYRAYGFIQKGRQEYVAYLTPLVYWSINKCWVVLPLFNDSFYYNSRCIEFDVSYII